MLFKRLYFFAHLFQRLKKKKKEMKKLSLVVLMVALSMALACSAFSQEGEGCNPEESAELADTGTEGEEEGVDLEMGFYGDGFNFNSVPVDLDNDGIFDGDTVDTDGDGLPDLVRLYNGDEVTLGNMPIDGDGDGQVDGLTYDEDSDGHPDGVILDSDGDGVPDTLEEMLGTDPNTPNQGGGLGAIIVEQGPAETIDEGEMDPFDINEIDDDGDGCPASEDIDDNDPNVQTGEDYGSSYDDVMPDDLGDSMEGDPECSAVDDF